MSHPSKGLNITIQYPEPLSIDFDIFGYEHSDVDIIDKPGLLRISSDKWFIPLSGIVYEFGSR